MGSLTYGSSVYEIEDRMLQHLKAVVATKLRRHESFTLAWNVEAAYGSGRVALWMHAGVPSSSRSPGRACHRSTPSGSRR